MNEDTYARAAHPNSTPIPHRWGNPAPGSGRMRICQHCGAKELSTSSDPNHPAYACTGPSPVAHARTDAEYDPF